MTEEHINLENFRIPCQELEERIKRSLNGRYCDYKEIIPLRKLKEIDDLAFMTQDFLEGLIRKIPIRGNTNIFPYENSSISLFSREPKNLLLSQRFVIETKLLNLMSSFSDNTLFKDFITKGISDMPPTKVYGKDENNNKVIAIYLPPLIEQRNQDEIILDGTHRCYICRSVGSEIYGIHIKNIEIDYPTTPVSWRECKLYKIKPPKEIRYKGLNEFFFRDLNYVGVDG
jgi:hypothetical protein